MPHLPNSTRRDVLTRGLGLIGVSTVLPEFLIRYRLGGTSHESPSK